MKRIAKLNQREVAGIFTFVLSLLPPWSRVNRLIISAVSSMAHRNKLKEKFPVDCSAVEQNIDCAMASLWTSAKLARGTEEEFLVDNEHALRPIMDYDAAVRVFSEDTRWANTHVDVLSLMASGSTARNIIKPKATKAIGDHMRRFTQQTFDTHLVDPFRNAITKETVKTCRRMIDDEAERVKAHEVLVGHRCIIVDFARDEVETPVKSYQHSQDCREGARIKTVAMGCNIVAFPTEEVLWPLEFDKNRPSVDPEVVHDLNLGRSILLTAIERARCKSLESILKVVERREIQG